MGSGHSKGRSSSSQEKLHTLFGDFSDTVRSQLLDALRQLARTTGSDRPIRVLDVGAGGMPYRGAFHDFGESNLDIVAVDACARPKAIRKDWTAKNWVKADFFTAYPGSILGHAGAVVDKKYPQARGPFDLIILAATLHELFYDCVTKPGVGEPAGFHSRLIRFLCENLLSKDGILLVADYAWLPEADACAVWEITNAQRIVTKHADPPWAFVTERWLSHQIEQDGIGLSLSSIHVQPLYNLSVDNTLVRRFAARLQQSRNRERLIATLPARVGYVTVYRHVKAQKTDQHKGVLPTLASVHVGARAARLFREGSDAAPIAEGLSDVFTVGDKSLLDRSAIWHFMRRMQMSLEEELGDRQTPGRDFPWEFWLGIGLRLGSKRRFVPIYKDVATGKEFETGFMGPLLSPEEGPTTLRPGVLSHPYQRILASRSTGEKSLHDWIATLHKWLREHGGVKTVTGRDLGRLRSITIVHRRMFAPDLKVAEAGRHSDDHCLRDAMRRGELAVAMTSLWGDEERQWAEGHYLLIIRGGECDQGSMAKQLADGLARIAKSILGLSATESLPDLAREALNWTDAQQVFYQKWLDAVFIDAGYQVYSTIALGCDGLSDVPPDTVMVFSELPFPPKTLDVVSHMMEDACRRVGQAEADTLLTQRTAEDTTQIMLTSFGHDAKRPADVVRLLLGRKESSARILARFCTDSLLNRLESYSRIDVVSRSRTECWEQLRLEQRRVDRWTTVEALWSEEALVQFIRMMIEPSLWEKIRSKGLQIQPGSEWGIVEAVFDTLIRASGEPRVGAERRSIEIARSDAIAQMALCRPPIRVLYEGPKIECPAHLNGEDGTPTSPKLATALGFVFAEWMTNAAKHVWCGLAHKAAGVKMNETGICYALKAVEKDSGFFFEGLFAPSGSIPEPVLSGAARTVTGLNSVKLALRSIGTQADEREVVWDQPERESISLGSLPWPRKGAIHGMPGSAFSFGPIPVCVFRGAQ